MESKILAAIGIDPAYIFIALIILIIILLVRPTGILGKKRREKV